MPEISRFLGISILMYFEDHNPPHFHVRYNEFEWVMNIQTLACIRGKLPPRILALVIERASMYQQELMKNRDLAVSGEQVQLQKITPLV